MSQLSFLSLGLRGRQLRSYRMLQEIDRVMPWDKLSLVIEPHYPKGVGGRPSKPLLLMLKIHCLQHWYNLSDPAMEDAIYDRNSFQQFLALDLLDETTVPDETTILTFRHLLEKHDLGQTLFAVIGEHLAEKGFSLKEGTIMDATLISAPKGRKKTRDPEMSNTRKGNNYTFGMKVHIGVDTRSGLVHSMVTTTANQNDITQAEKLQHGEERALFGDKGYAKQAIKRMCRAKGIFYGIADKAEKHRKLSNKQERRNDKLASMRAKVEHPFRVVKYLWGHRQVRYRGLKKNTNHMFMLFGLANLYSVRRTLLAAA